MGGAARYRARLKVRAEMMEAERRIREAMEAREAREAMEADWLRNKSLYICTSDDFQKVDYRGNNPVRYVVQVIKLSDLLSFSDIPITVFTSRSKSKSCQQEEQQLGEVDFIDSDDLPSDMGFGIFGSRIVLAGGSENSEGPNESYVLETDPSVEPKPRFIGTRSRECQPHYAIPEFKGVKPDPLLVEIKGKLYALAGIDFSRESPAFEVFDPETKLWTTLPTPPKWMAESKSWIPRFCYAVVGTKILVTPSLGKTYCFDVANPERSWHVLKWRKGSFPDCFSRALVLDLEDDRDKLMFTYELGNDRIEVHCMKLSDEGEPIGIKLVAEIMLPNQFTAESYSCTHLGGRKVCFLFMDWECPIHTMNLYAMTFEFLYSKSAASTSSTPDITSSSASDPYFLHCISICGSFSAKLLGSRFFIYNGTEESLSLCAINLGGCFVL